MVIWINVVNEPILKKVVLPIKKCGSIIKHGILCWAPRRAKSVLGSIPGKFTDNIQSNNVNIVECCSWTKDCCVAT